MTSRSEAVLEQKLGAVWPMLEGRTRRLLAANEALALGYGGVSRVHRAYGLSRAAITSGIREIEEEVQLVPGRVCGGPVPVASGSPSWTPACS